MKTIVFIAILPLFIIAILFLYIIGFKDIFFDKEAPFILKFIYTVFGIFAILILVISIIFGVYLIYKYFFEVEKPEQLTQTTVTASTLITTIIGYYYTKKQDRIRDIHTESQWRSRLLNLEKKPQYDMNDLLELNSFINPYHKKNDNLDFLVSYAIKIIQQNHSDKANERDENEFLNFYKLVSDSKISNELKTILQRENPDVQDTFNFSSDSKDSIITINLNKDIKINIMSNYAKQETFSLEENTVIRKCIHALLKNDWMNAYA